MQAVAMKIERKEIDSSDISEVELTGFDNNLDVGHKRGRNKEWLRLTP